MASQPRNIPNNHSKSQFNGQHSGTNRSPVNTEACLSYSFNQRNTCGTNLNTGAVYYNKKDAPKQLNPNNRLIDENVIYKLFKKFGINEKIGNLEYYQLAFVHKSYVKNESDESDGNFEEDNDEKEVDEEKTEDKTSHVDDDVKSALNENADDPVVHIVGEGIVPFQNTAYERLEYIGDAILNAVVANYVFNRYPNEPEGFLTTLRTKLVRSNTLAKLAAKLKIQKYILISKHVEERCNGRKNPKILEDIFEAIVGAMFLDFGPEDRGWNVCQKFIVNVFETFIDITSLIRKEDNYKRILLEFYQKKYHTEPKYQIISMRGSTNRRTYTMGALSPTGEIVGIGIERRKTDAEQIASRKALIYYGEDVDSADSGDSAADSSSSDEDS